MMKII